jgi:predicted RNase H-like HicB family nuclease
MNKTMEKNKVIVGINYSGNNFGAHVPLLPGCVATGNTPEAIMKNINEAILFHIESSLEDGDFIDAIFKSDYKLVYKFDAVSLLNYYKGIFTNSALEKITGINQRQLQHYSSGLRKPRIEQREKIEKALHKLGKELLAVEL